jgi:hypothetical protein
LVEQAAVNRFVAGSSPAPGANEFKGLSDIRLAPFSLRDAQGNIWGNIWGNIRCASDAVQMIEKLIGLR